MKKIAPIIILTIISAFLIFYRFADIPKYLAFDEVEFTKLALSLNNKPYIPYSQLATGHSTLYFYIILTSLKTFGINTFALRFPAAIFGILSVITFYLVVRLSFRASARNLATEGSVIKHNYASLDFSVASLLRNDMLFPFLLTLILLSSRWFLNFARFSFEATFLLFLELTSIHFLLLANAQITNFLRLGIPPKGEGSHRRQKISLSSIDLILSGLFAGLAFLSYTPGRIFFILPMSFMILSFPRRRESSDSGSPIRSGMTHILCFLIPFLIIITPLTSYLINNKDTRIDQEFFLNNHEVSIPVKISGLWQNISSTALMFNIKGDVNGRQNYPNKPALNPLLGILFIVGLIITIKQWKNDDNRLFLVYFFLSLFPALMTYPWENPSMLRTYTVIPAVIYFVGQGIIFVLDRFQNNRKKFGMTLIIVLILISSFYELRTYFKYQSIVFNQSFEIKLPLEKAIKIKTLP